VQCNTVRGSDVQSVLQCWRNGTGLDGALLWTVDRSEGIAMHSATAVGGRGLSCACDVGYQWENRLEWRAVLPFFFATTDIPHLIPDRVEVPQKLLYALATLHTA